MPTMRNNVTTPKKNAFIVFLICQRDPLELFDHLGGAQQNRFGYGKAERLGGLEVHSHLKFGRKLHGEIARLRAPQNAIDIGGGATPVVYLVGSVGEQAAVSD